ncbi:MAG: hypothetical protein RI952_848 [Bacteroidota bacterium]|jgi:tRNA G18 (ribose-2'-O)-methylase SpoU
MKKLKLEELGRVDVATFKSTTKTPIVIVLDNIRSMNNIGSVFRSADAFAVEAVYLCGITAQPPHREIEKTALGATESVQWKYFESTHLAIQDLKQNSYQIACIEQVQNSVSLAKLAVDTNEKYALVFGNEVMGVDQEVINQSDMCIEIPQFGTKHSFNISVTAGIVLWEFYRQLHK